MSPAKRQNPDDTKYYILKVRRDWESLGNIPIEMQTYSICREAVRQNGNALKYVRQDLMNFALCRNAVRNNYEAFHFVPNKISHK